MSDIIWSTCYQWIFRLKFATRLVSFFPSLQLWTVSLVVPLFGQSGLNWKQGSYSQWTFLFWTELDNWHPERKIAVVKWGQFLHSEFAAGDSSLFVCDLLLFKDTEDFDTEYERITPYIISISEPIQHITCSLDLTWFWLEPPNRNAFLSSFRGLDWHILARSLLRCPAPAWPACAFCCCQPGSQCYVKLGWWSCRANKDIMLYQGRHIFREAEGGRYDVKWYQNITPTIQVTWLIYLFIYLFIYWLIDWLIDSGSCRGFECPGQLGELCRDGFGGWSSLVKHPKLKWTGWILVKQFVMTIIISSKTVNHHDVHAAPLSIMTHNYGEKCHDTSHKTGRLLSVESPSCKNMVRGKQNLHVSHLSPHVRSRSSDSHYRPPPLRSMVV